MADIKQIQVGENVFNLKDETAREALEGKQDAITAVVSPTVTEDGGDPSASVEFENGQMSFAFSNLKGDTGETGPEGPQGDSVLVGQGDLPLAHVLGQDNTKAMSQKGVTDVVNDMMKKTEENGFFFTDSNRNIGAWMDSLGFHAPNLVEMSALSGLFWQIIADVFVDVVEAGFYVVDSNRNIGFCVNATGAHAANLVEY